MKKIRINQAGYTNALSVKAVVLDDCRIELKNDRGECVRFIKAQHSFMDPSSREVAGIADLGFLENGNYTLEYEGETEYFSVSRMPYAEPLRKMLKGLYYQRCGCALEEKHAGCWTHAACHTADAYLYSDPLQRLNVAGGWHDAGDFGRYTGPGAVTVAHLLYAWLLFEASFKAETGIPESGNGIADVLNECRYELEWLLKMQRSDGAVYHKVTKKQFAPFIMPQNDMKEEFVLPPSHCATAAVCACFALSASVWKPIDPRFSSQLEQAALKAWQWLEQHPDFVPYKNPADVRTGEYGDNSCEDELFWAACELFALTGEEKYIIFAKEKLNGLNLTSFGWRDVAAFGAVCCLFRLKNRIEGKLYQTILKRFLAGANALKETSEQSAFGTALSEGGYVWGSSMLVMNAGMVFACAYLLTGEKEYIECSQNQLNYILGMNALDLSLVTGIGSRSFKNPHHRPSGSDGIEAPVPGLVSGGPNKRFVYPQTRERLGEDVPAAKYYLDELPSADTNEIAIYWNSPAIFVAAFLNSLCMKDE